MGRASIMETLRQFIGSVAWRIFLWSIGSTEEVYWEDIYEQERRRKEGW